MVKDKRWMATSAFVVSINDEAGQTVLRVILSLTVEYPSDVKE